MRRIIFAAATAALLSAGVAHAAITQTSFVQVSSPSLFNGFEGMPSFAETQVFHVGAYSEGGITVEYKGDEALIWNELKVFEGERSWSKLGGGLGYTAIRLSRARTAVISPVSPLPSTPILIREPLDFSTKW